MGGARLPLVLYEIIVEKKSTIVYNINCVIYTQKNNKVFKKVKIWNNLRTRLKIYSYI